MWIIRLAFPLTTEYGSERKPSGEQWEKMDFGQHYANVLIDETFDLNTVLFSQN